MPHYHWVRVEVLATSTVFTDNLGQRVEWSHHSQIGIKVLTPHYLAFLMPAEGKGRELLWLELGKGLSLDSPIIFFLWYLAGVEQLFSKSYLFC